MRTGGGFVAGVRRTLLITLLGVLVATFGFTTVGIDGDSMAPTLHDGERAWVPRYETWLRRLGAGAWGEGDIVYFRAPGAEARTWLDRVTGGPFLIKRIVAVAGQTIELRRGHLWIDGAATDEPYLDGLEVTVASRPLERVPDDHVYVMGDNRAPLASRDSRVFGPVPLAQVAGRAAWVVWPWLRPGADGGWRWNPRAL
jgi:signal peptidase I